LQQVEDLRQDAPLSFAKNGNKQIQKRMLMTFFQYTEKLETIKHLAKYKQAGTAEQLAQKLEVSQRTVERMIQQLRDNGYPIRYNRNRNTYELKE
jgi:biotin operon repressor